MRTSDKLTQLVNRSGYPLQMAVDGMISTDGSLGWKVLSREAGWENARGGSGFIDLVLEDQWQSSVMVIECKRVLESDWLFLIDAGKRQPTKRARLWVSNTPGHGRAHFGYFDVKCEPKSEESMFCVVPGQDSKSPPMLERVAGEVSEATAALALEEHQVMLRREYGIRVYASLIVTTARLHLTGVNSSEVSLSTGEVPAATHEEVPWVRFRKALAPVHLIEPDNPVEDFSALSKSREKLVFVVNVTHLQEFLRKWNVSAESYGPLMRGA